MRVYFKNMRNSFVSFRFSFRFSFQFSFRFSFGFSFRFSCSYFSLASTVLCVFFLIFYKVCGVGNFLVGAGQGEERSGGESYLGGVCLRRMGTEGGVKIEVKAGEVEEIDLKVEETAAVELELG